MGNKNRHWIFDPIKRERILLMAGIEFKLRYYENKLGLIWALIKPALNVAVYYTVFQVIMGQEIENFALFLFLGLLIWQYFSEGTSGLIRVLQTKKYLYDHTSMAKSEIYFSAIIANTIGLGINLLVYLIFALIVQVLPGWTVVFFPLVLLNLILLTSAVALILSNVFLLFKDIQQVWGIVLMAGFFLSPIFYSPDRFASSIPLMSYLNPMSGIIVNARNTVMYNQLPDWGMLGFDFLYAALLFMLGVFMLKKYSPKASELL